MQIDRKAIFKLLEMARSGLYEYVDWINVYFYIHSYSYYVHRALFWLQRYDNSVQHDMSQWPSGVTHTAFLDSGPKRLVDLSSTR